MTTFVMATTQNVTECQVCVCKLNKVTRKLISCDFCEFSACTTCYRKYIFESGIRAQCMSCKQQFTRTALRKKFSDKFVNTEYRIFKESLLFEQERSMMPGTQPEVTRIILERKIRNDLALSQRARSSVRDTFYHYITIHTKLNSDVSKLIKKHSQDCACAPPYTPKGQERHTKFIETKETLELLIDDVSSTTCEIAQELQEMSDAAQPLHDQLRELYYAGGDTPGDTTTTKTVVFTHKCMRDSCKGFLNPDWICGICGYLVCKKCYIVIGESTKDAKGKVVCNEGHECKQEDVDTAKLLRDNTRNCPTCGMGIFRVEGCPQMFCTGCHTAFDFRTGQVITGVIHNPHFFEWRRLTGRGAGQGLGDFAPLCGRELDHNLVIHVSNLYHRYHPQHLATATDSQKAFSTEALQKLLDIHQWQIRRFRTDYFENNRDLRIRYMMNETNEIDFKKEIQRREKRVDKFRDITQILIMYTNCYTDIIYRFLDEESKGVVFDFGRITPFEDEVIALRGYTNDSFVELAKDYKCKVWSISRINAFV